MYSNGIINYKVDQVDGYYRVMFSAVDGEWRPLLDYPCRATMHEAQIDLQTYADKKGLHMV